eukprot:TRINITY_DN966_c0_g1_i23.p1 TRINITY_DN966_c0_g1~~TRINITY_DN966_c0_g1_i23.p1  ORF type:complete len:166 (-),score=42.06 TRINITY_DN966_c0_g1_i23:77-574(-)
MLNRSSVSCSPFFLPPVSSQVLFFFSSRRRHTRSVSAFLLNRSSDLFYQEENGLFMSLFRDEMKATPTQIAQLLKLRTQMQQQSIKMKDQVLVDAFHAFEKVLLQRGRLQQPDVFEQLRMIFTPRQLATYFRYVSQYGSVLIKVPEIGRAVQQECRDRSRMPSSA